MTCTGTGGSGTASVSVSITNPTSFAVTPRNAALTLKQAQTFTAAAPNSGAVTWTVDGISGGSVVVGTIDGNGTYTPPTTAGTHTVLATSVADPTMSGSAAIAVTDLAGIYSFHTDQARSGANLKEYALTPTALTSGSFGKRFSCPVDGDITAQPLYVANLAIGGGTHNVLYVATQNDSVYAFDADDTSCKLYWSVIYTANPNVTVSALTYQDLGGCNDIQKFGITGTPVIDPTTQLMYFVAATKENGTPTQRLHALNITTGAEAIQPATATTLAGVVIAATINGSGANDGSGKVSFSALWHNQRSGLVLSQGGVFIAWAAHCDIGQYWGWMMRYDAATLQQTSVFNVAPNGTRGGIWMSGGAPAVDSAGSMFLSSGNGTFDNTTSTIPAVAPHDDFSMSFLNFNTATLTVQDFYTPTDEASWNSPDLDISASGVNVLPDGIGPAAHPNLLTGSDKQGHLWMIDRMIGSMSGFNSSMDGMVQYGFLPVTANCTQKNCVLSTPAYYNKTLYIVPAQNAAMAIPILSTGLYGFADGQDTIAVSSLSAETYGYPGASPSISASPTGNGIVWVLDNSGFGSQGNNGTSAALTAVLRAYDASNVASKLFDSSVLPADKNGNAVKFTTPVIANGHVYVGGDLPDGKEDAKGQLTVYGLAP